MNRLLLLVLTLSLLVISNAAAVEITTVSFGSRETFSDPTAVTHGDIKLHRVSDDMSLVVTVRYYSSPSDYQCSNQEVSELLNNYIDKNIWRKRMPLKSDLPKINEIVDDYYIGKDCAPVAFFSAGMSLYSY